MRLVGKKVTIEALSLIFGLLLFAFVVKLAGFGNVIDAIKNFSPFFLVPYILVAIATTHWAAAYRWKFVLLSEDINVPIFTLLKYKAMIFGINYLTPVARIGGEPLKVLLLKRQQIKIPKSVASVVVDNFLGMGMDVAIAGIILIVLVFTATTLSANVKGIFLIMGIALPLLVLLLYIYLKKKTGPFTSVLKLAGRLTSMDKKKSFAAAIGKASKSEYYMRKLLVKRPRNMMFAAICAAMSWPLTVIQYKLALLMLGVDASLVQILVSVIMTNVLLLIPIPAGIGVQEAGQFSTFRFISANPQAGIALSLVLRFKDMVLLLISFLLVSHDGINIFGKKALGLEKEEAKKKK